ncbi:TPA: serine--tRNA ligase, partial [bacterium]|nr:serine--tRNA ligase [bacterium]
MLDLRFVRENIDLILEKTQLRGITIDFKSFKELDNERRGLIRKVEDLRAQKNKLSEEFGRKKREGVLTEADINENKKITAKISDEIKEIEERLRVIEENHKLQLLSIPNIPHSSVPVGKSSEENLEIRRWGEIRKFGFEPKPHWELGELLDIIDFERAGKLTGARFSILKGWGSKLERALINFMLDLHTEKHSYKEMLPPFIVNKDSMTGTGQLPKFAEDLFKLEGYDYYLIPTAEVPVTNYFRDEILNEDMLPVYFTAYTPCFRAEAGSYGKDTKGIIRQHQFDKLELVK